MLQGLEKGKLLAQSVANCSIFLHMQHKYRTRIQGESLQAKIREYEFKILEQVIFPLYFGIVSLFAWGLSLGWMTFNYITATICTIVMLFFIIRSYRKIKKLRWTLDKYRKGLEGERLVGETLNQLSGDTTYVFHDIPGERFNVDHIIVSTRGVYVIETKHFDRNLCHEFFFDGSMVYRLLKNGKRFPCPKLLPQIDGEAQFIRQEIEKRAEIKLPVIKVAILIGSFIHNDGKLNDYWLLNEKAFVKFFKAQKEIYDKTLVNTIANQIREMVKIDVDG